jgi:hypothetical protein
MLHLYVSLQLFGRPTPLAGTLQVGSNRADGAHAAANYAGNPNTGQRRFRAILRNTVIALVESSVLLTWCGTFRNCSGSAVETLTSTA